MLSTIEQALFILAVPYSVAGTIFKFVLIEPFDLLRKSGTTISIFWLFGQWLPSLHNSQRLNRYNYSGSNRTAWLYARIIEAYVYSSFEQYTVPFYRYNHSITMQLFYTTNMCEIGTVYPGLVGRYGYRCEGIIGYVVSTERSSANINKVKVKTTEGMPNSSAAFFGYYAPTFTNTGNTRGYPPDLPPQQSHAPREVNVPSSTIPSVPSTAKGTGGSSTCVSAVKLFLVALLGGVMAALVTIPLTIALTRST
ncbi:unnamed protein product, partial [Rotaria socialis]